MKVVKIKPQFENWMAFDPKTEMGELLELIKDMIDEIADGEVINLVVEEMDEKEFDSLPEFTGW